MILKLVRENFTTESTIGRLYANGVFLCYILEDTNRDLTQTMSPEEIAKIKVHGKTCVPYGTYSVIISYSNRFKKDLPLVVSVPGFEGIRIHPGNKAVDTEGCLLPGNIRKVNEVLESRLAWQKVFNIIKEAIDHNDKITIVITK